VTPLRGAMLGLVALAFGCQPFDQPFTARL
jgi:hypothetical protein